MSVFETIASAVFIPEMVVAYKSQKASSEQIEAAGKYLVEPFDNLPTHRPDVTIVLGATIVTPILARRTAELAARNPEVDMIGDKLVFSGGVGVYNKAFSASVLRTLAQEGFDLPRNCKTEAEMGAKVFATEYNKLTGRQAEKDFEILIENKSTNTQQNFSESAKLLGDVKSSCMNVVCIPCCARRAVATGVRMFGYNPVIAPVLAWLDEIGITRESWMNNPLARVLTLGEYDKIKPTNENPAGLYVSKGYCEDVNLEKYLKRNQLVMQARNAATYG